MSPQGVTQPRRAFRTAGWAAVMSLLILAASACGGSPANALTPTLTAGMGGLPQKEASTESAAGFSAATTAGAKQPFDICALITRQEAEDVLGQPVLAVTPGEDPDTAFGGTLHFCTHLGRGLAVAISLADLGSAGAAEKAMRLEFATLRADDSSTAITQESGVGDQMYWVVNSRAASYTVWKGSMVFSVLLGGHIGDPEKFKAGLLNLAGLVASRL